MEGRQGLLDQVTVLAGEPVEPVGEPGGSSRADAPQDRAALGCELEADAAPVLRRAHALQEPCGLEARGDTANLARSLFNRGAVDLMVGEHDAASARFRESLRLAGETGDAEDVAWCLEGLAAVAVEAGEGERAATRL